jgi:hypothetical protein
MPAIPICAYRRNPTQSTLIIIYVWSICNNAYEYDQQLTPDSRATPLVVRA